MKNPASSGVLQPSGFFDQRREIAQRLKLGGGQT